LIYVLLLRLAETGIRAGQRVRRIRLAEML
jgi:hypothetical protein